MKLAVYPFLQSDIQSLAEKGADIFILGNEQFANRLATSFTMNEIIELSTSIKSLGKEVYISMNLVIHNKDIKDIESSLKQLKEIQIDGIIFGDLGLYNIAKRQGMEHLLIYNPETLNTNFYDKTFWAKKHIKGLIISKEITLHDIVEITKDKTIEIGIVGHGHLNMFHSRRPLISNFFKYNEEEHKEYINNRNLRLVEELRDEVYPVFEDNHGTHIFREKAMESYNEAITLNENIDFFIIDPIFKDAKYLQDAVENYNEILQKKDQQTAHEISEKYIEDHDSGFLYKKTVYDKY